MFLLIGLGNPGSQYDGTRHNVGFEVIHSLSGGHNIAINKAKHRAHIGEGHIANEKVLLVKPQTYMNLSGESVRDILHFYKLTPQNMIVIYDDVSLNTGQIRIREKGSAGGHNGMKNIIYQLDTDEFIRIRVGIGNKPAGWDLADYVLSRFRPNEIDDIVDGVAKANAAVTCILKDGTASAMNQYNPK